MTKEEVANSLKSWGVGKRFKFSRLDAESNLWVLECRNPARLQDGYLLGTSVSVDFERRGFVVWTDRRRLAKALCSEHGVRVNLLDGEAEFFCPGEKADVLLPRFGVKVRKTITDSQKAVLASARLKARYV